DSGGLQALADAQTDQELTIRRRAARPFAGRLLPQLAVPWRHRCTQSHTSKLAEHYSLPKLIIARPLNACGVSGPPRHQFARTTASAASGERPSRLTMSSLASS